MGISELSTTICSSFSFPEKEKKWKKKGKLAATHMTNAAHFQSQRIINAQWQGATKKNSNFTPLYYAIKKYPEND